METGKKLRVLHIASWYPSKVHDSLGNFIQRHIRAISTLHNCELWYASPVSVENPLIGNIEVRDGGGFTEKITYPMATKPGVRAVTRSLLRLLPGEDVSMPDLIHLHVAFPAGRAARILAERWDLPLVVTEHWTAYHDSQHIPLWRRMSMRRTAAATSVFCPVTDQLGQKMREFKMNNSSNSATYKTIPNVVDTDLFTPGEGNSDNCLKIIHVSSLNESQKNITGILHTMTRLKNSNLEFCIAFVGGSDTEKLNKLKSYATGLGLTNTRIKFTGPKSSQEVAEMMKQADGLVLFSRKENFPCVIAEAWATGIPVISTDVGGIAEHMDDSRGMLVKSEDEGALADAIINLKKNWDKEAIRKYAVDHFSVDAVAKQYDEAYRVALGE